MTQTLSATDVRSNWSQLLKKIFLGETEILVEKSGIPVAAIVSAQDYNKLLQIKKRSEEDLIVVNEIRAAFADQTPEQIDQGIKESLTQVRARKSLHLSK